MIRLFINEVELDVSEDISFPLTYSQADAKNPDKRKRNSSKPIKLPGTKTNNKFFSSAWDLNISNVYDDLIGFDFDPTLRYPCLVTRKGSPVFRGTAQLTKVNTKRDVTNGRINEFTVVLYSEIADIFQLLGDIKVSELGWSAYDHTLNVTNIQNSWTAATGSGYWYPYIHFGLSQDPQYILTNQLRPYVYVKEIVEKCFAHAGFTMSSSFFDLTLIKKIAWGYGGGEPILLSSSEVTARRVHYTGDGSNTYNLGPSFINGLLDQTDFHHNLVVPVSTNSIVTMTLQQDPTSQYSTSTGEIVIAHGGYFNLALSGTYPVTYAYSDPGLTGQHFGIVVSWRVFVNNALVNTFSQSIVTTTAGTTNVTFNENQVLDVSTGDVVYQDIQITTFGCFVQDNAIGETLDLTFDLNNTLDFDMTAINSGLIDGDTVQVARFLPEMKAKDFLKDMITMFNLYVSDPDANGVITVEPQDTYFFDTDDMDNWTDKIDRSSDIEIKPAANIEGKIYRFMWAQDRDYFKQLYFETYGQDYGDYDYNVPSTFKTGEKIYKLGIAQSCPVQIEGTDIIIPFIVKFEESTGVYSPHKGKPRIFLNNGTTACDAWKLVNSDTGAETILGTQPIAHHLDSLSAATFDLNFGRPEVVFYTATTYTTDNLFYNYHAQFIRELTGRDSKIVNAWFRLREDDFYENFMRRLCNIDGVAYRKNLIKDWEANDNKLIKVELVKILDGKSRGVYQYNNVPAPYTPPFDNGGDGNPITNDVTVRSDRTFYPIDPSAKDVIVTLTGEKVGQPFTGIRPGKKFHIFKTTASGKITITATGGALIYNGTAAPATSMTLTGKGDNVMIIYDTAGGNYYVI